MMKAVVRALTCEGDFLAPCVLINEDEGLQAGTGFGVSNVTHRAKLRQSRARGERREFIWGIRNVCI